MKNTGKKAKHPARTNYVDRACAGSPAGSRPQAGTDVMGDPLPIEKNRKDRGSIPALSFTEPKLAYYLLNTMFSL